MLRLNSTSKKLQAKLAGAITTSQLPVIVMYSDGTASTYVGGSNLTVTNSTTAVDICPSPAASTVRDVDYLSIKNEDTAATTVTIIYNDSATLYNIITVLLDVGDQLTYTHGEGWHTVKSTGAIKISHSYELTSNEKDALAGTNGTPSASNKFVTDSDPRNSDARTPLAHTHPESDVVNLVSDLATKQANVQYKDEGSNIGGSGATTAVNFVGAGVTAAFSAGTVTVTIPEVATRGSAVIDFGAGNQLAQVTVTGQTNISATSKVIPYVMADVSSDNNEDSHLLMSSITVFTVPKSSIVVGTSFIIKAFSDQFLYGTYIINWIGNY